VADKILRNDLEGFSMKSVTKLALFAALGALTVSPTYAADAEKPKKEKKGAKEKAPAPIKRAYSKEFTAAYGPAGKLLQKKDNAGAKAMWPQIKASIMNDDDRYEAGLFAYNVGRDTTDTALQNEGLDLMIASPATPADLRKSAAMQRGQMAYNAKQYDVAEKFLRQAYDAGHRGNNVELLLSNSFVLRGNHAEALNWIQKGIDNTRATGGVPDKQWFAQAMSYAGKTKDKAKISYWGKELIKADPRGATYHDTLFNFLFVNQAFDNHETLDVFRLARKTGAIVQEREYVQFLDSLNPALYPAEALAIIAEGTASGKIPKNDQFFNEKTQLANSSLVQLKQSWDQDEKSALANAKGFSALLFGENMLGFGEYARAQKLLEAALAKGGIIDRDGKDQTDRARTRLGIAKVMQGNFAGAKTDFEAITHPARKSIAEYWLIYISQQGV
jgi:hypothetical protein